MRISLASSLNVSKLSRTVDESFFSYNRLLGSSPCYTRNRYGLIMTVPERLISSVWLQVRRIQCLSRFSFYLRPLTSHTCVDYKSSIPAYLWLVCFSFNFSLLHVRYAVGLKLVFHYWQSAIHVILLGERCILQDNQLRGYDGYLDAERFDAMMSSGKDMLVSVTRSGVNCSTALSFWARSGMYWGGHAAILRAENAIYVHRTFIQCEKCMGM